MPTEHTEKHGKKIKIALLLLAVGIGLVNVFLMPPFMNPDEIQHFMFSANYAYEGDEEALKNVDRRVLQLLKDHKWFHFIGVGPGWESIDKIEDIYFLNYFTREKQSISRTYFHFIYGKILKLTGIKEPLTAFYFLRLLSFLVYLGIFFLSFFFYKKYFPAHWYYLIAGQLVIFQLATILNSVNYDVLLTLLGVLFFIFAYRFMVSDEKRDIIYLIFVSALASLIKTGGLLFFIYFFILLLFKYRISMKFLKPFLLALFLFIIVFSWFNYWFPERFFALYSVIFAKLRTLGAFASNSTAAGMGFFDSILDSFYFHTGWMAFKLPGIWYILLKVFLLVSLIGAGFGVFMKKLNTAVLERKWLFYALLVIFIHIVSIRLYYGGGLTAQGRYLFPLIIPSLIFVYSGLEYMKRFLKWKGDYIKISFLIFQLVFLIFAFICVISVFYLEIPSPHPRL